MIRTLYKLLGRANTARVLMSGNPARIMRHVARKSALKASSRASVTLWPTAKRKGKK
jgi:hypothetical protein